MSSHREAPEISKDPVADSTDLYAFRSPAKPDSVTIIANYIPLQGPAAGPNFYEFGNDVLYEIHIDNNGDAQPEIVYQLRFESEVSVPGTFLYNVGPISTLDSKYWNRKQFYSVTRVEGGRSELLARKLPCPPCNIGPLSTSNYQALAGAAIHALPGERRVFAGQRADAFYVDLGAIFDLGVLRPLAALHSSFGLAHLSNAAGVDTTRYLNVHSIALEVPIAELVGGAIPGDATAKNAVIGVWTSASRQKARVLGDNGEPGHASGPYVQVSRLGNPLFNEVLVPMAMKDAWNASAPSGDSRYAAGVAHPELASLLNVLYPGAFPNIAAYSKARADLEAILLTGIPAGVVSANFTTYTGSTQADMLRLNVAIPPAATPSPLGVLGGDLAGFPNGRRVTDDVVTIELRAVAGATIPLVDKSFVPDKAVAAVTDGLTGAGLELMSDFPYLSTPYSGYDHPAQQAG